MGEPHLQTQGICPPPSSGPLSSAYSNVILPVCSIIQSAWRFDPRVLFFQNNSVSPSESLRASEKHRGSADYSMEAKKRKAEEKDSLSRYVRRGRRVASPGRVVTSLWPRLWQLSSESERLVVVSGPRERERFIHTLWSGEPLGEKWTGALPKPTCSLRRDEGPRHLSAAPHAPRECPGVLQL